MIGRTQRERQKARRVQSAARHAHFGPRLVSGRASRAWVPPGGNRSSVPRAFGDATTEADVYAMRRPMVAAQAERVFAASLPLQYSALDGTPCLEAYSARNQGTCGACYASFFELPLTLAQVRPRRSLPGKFSSGRTLGSPEVASLYFSTVSSGTT